MMNKPRIVRRRIQKRTERMMYVLYWLLILSSLGFLLWNIVKTANAGGLFIYAPAPDALARALCY